MIKPPVIVLPITGDTVGVRLFCSGKGLDEAVRLRQKRPLLAVEDSQDVQENCTEGGRVQGRFCQVWLDSSFFKLASTGHAKLKHLNCCLVTATHKIPKD